MRGAFTDVSSSRQPGRQSSSQPVHPTAPRAGLQVGGQGARAWQEPPRPGVLPTWAAWSGQVHKAAGVSGEVAPGASDPSPAQEQVTTQARHWLWERQPGLFSHQVPIPGD